VESPNNKKGMNFNVSGFSKKPSLNVFGLKNIKPSTQLKGTCYFKL
jgi:hypothetical protein